jgi:GT2 family glycosyltransferase
MASALRSLARLGKRFVQTVRTEGLAGVKLRARRVRQRFLDAINPPANPVDWSPTRQWFERFRPDPEQLAYFSITRWPADAPRFSILMPVYNVREAWLREAIQSVRTQVYPHWELICVNDASPARHVRKVLSWAVNEDPKVKVIHHDRNRGVCAATNTALAAAAGDYVCFMDHDDALEPHALHQFARAILQDQPDLLYSDEVVTGEDLDDMLGVNARGAFSYDFYLSHPYFVHLVGVRTDLARRVGGLDERLTVSQDVDLVLKLLEVCRSVSYVPDVLYRWRTHTKSSGHVHRERVKTATREALERHLYRIGADAEVVDHDTPYNFRDVRFRHAAPARVAIIIPTKNQAGYLRGCVESLRKTVRPGLADVVVIDHESDEPDTRSYLTELAATDRVLPYRGPFNFAAIMNYAVDAVRGRYTHYLLLNNDTAAIELGWLEHMLGFGRRPDVGVVGAMLLYPDDTIQHAGVVVGLQHAAEHSHKFWRFRHGPTTARREQGQGGSLVCNRDCSSVTGACLLIRADVFEQVGGFDERLAVGFNDIDLCLRVREQGYKVIQDAYAVLYHFESQTRGVNNRHPEDTAWFCHRHQDVIRDGDPFYSPLLTRISVEHFLCSYARSPVHVRPYTTPVVLPTAAPSALPATVPLRRAG